MVPHRGERVIGDLRTMIDAVAEYIDPEDRAPDPRWTGTSTTLRPVTSSLSG